MTKLGRPDADSGVGESYVNHGQVGAMGRGAVASNNSFQQLTVDATKSAELAAELERLQKALPREAAGEDVEAIVLAKVEGRHGRWDKALGFLLARGKNILEVAEKEGLKLLVTYLHAKAGLPPG